MSYTFHFGVIWDNLDRLLAGLALGLGLALVAIAIGAVIGLAFAFAGTGRVRLLRGLVAGYVTVIRNTPILVIVLIVYFALPELGVRLGKYESFIFSLAIYAAAYLTEVFRAGLTSVPAGVVDAGRAIGLRGVHLSLLVVFPIMLRNALPALGSTFISLFKDTSIAAAIAVPELTFEARKINVESFRVIEAWITATALYVATCALIAAGLRRLERRFPRF
jgi:His/Glu/Gln/Arg/opine family amino acid ABC transporter permease subunit